MRCHIPNRRGAKGSYQVGFAWLQFEAEDARGEAG
jgi:hypothetical protein